MKKYNINNLEGVVLIASPKLRFDPLFAESVVYLTSKHVSGGIEGFIINKPTKLPFYKLLRMVGSKHKINISRSVIQSNMVLIGGSENTKSTFIIDQELRSNILTEKVLEYIVMNSEEKKFEVLAGVTAWAPGQLEREIFDNRWVLADPETNIMFNTPYSERYNVYVENMGLSGYFKEIKKNASY